ncbi:hypothetical protein BHE74_00056184, partial [Ensete ventricosum]
MVVRKRWCGDAARMRSSRLQRTEEKGQRWCSRRRRKMAVAKGWKLPCLGRCEEGRLLPRAGRKQIGKAEGEVEGNGIEAAVAIEEGAAVAAAVEGSTVVDEAMEAATFERDMTVRCSSDAVGRRDVAAIEEGDGFWVAAAMTKATAGMQLGTVEICDPSRRQKQGGWSERQQRCGRCRNSGERTAAAGSCGCDRGLEMVMAALQREVGEVATLGQRWQREITAIEAGSVVQVAMLAVAEGKKGDSSMKMAATGKKQCWDRWQRPLERTTEG